MNQPEERKEIDLKGIEISPELLNLLQMTQDKGNGYLDSHVDAVAEAICHIGSTAAILDDEHSEKIRFMIIKELISVRELLQKLGRTILTAIFLLFEPELLSNLYELGDIYVY